MGEAKNKKMSNVNPEMQEQETEVFEGEVVNPEDIEGETKDAKAKTKKSKKDKGEGFFKRTGRKIKGALEDITVWDVVKGIGLVGTGIGIGVIGTLALGSRSSCDSSDPDALPDTGDYYDTDEGSDDGPFDD